MRLECDDATMDVRRAAILAAQLPRESRTVRAFAPSAQNGTVEQLLRQIEYNQRLWHWAHTKSAKSGSSKPEHMNLPGEVEQVAIDREREERNARIVAETFGL